MRIFPTLASFVLSLGLFPLLALGQVTPPTDFKSFVGVITNLISILILFVFALTFIVFLWGIIKNWIMKGGDTEGVESGKKIVSTGIIVIVVMFAIWGILYVLQVGLFG